MDTPSASLHPAPLRQRLVWFAAIWVGSVLSLGAVAGILRAWLKAA